ncbi:uncharacterized protein PADG_01420 [Paracoccidioides brasiliensis Pb18]|uniref:Uncharacterized protein n=1 Tax=Paracoccidioides brasiliensis (strain Pb18) TaxID=502780 RepID=C1G3A4_PARBD|nr:uncharacterized protein PADG_01420 [Paracoccidioides brasiliensis Pb18]EEH45270.2 hypothetical protein PADG_01420 [Paracoccidioides brasiliensis Pb18]
MLEYPLKEEKERRKYAKLNELKTTAGDIFTYYNVLKWQENIFLLFKGQLWNYGTGGANVQGIILGARGEIVSLFDVPSSTLVNCTGNLAWNEIWNEHLAPFGRQLSLE